MRPFVVLLGGGTASGKTTLALRLAAETGALHLGHDRYYRDIPDPVGFNYDHPDALDTERLAGDLAALRTGRTVDLPVYDFRTHRRRAETEPAAPRPLVVVEGILVLHDARLRAQADLRVYVDASDDIRLARRILRDVVARGRTVDSVIAQYLATVRPMHRTFIQPSRAWAEVMIDGEDAFEASYARLLAGIAEGGGPVGGV